MAKTIRDIAREAGVSVSTASLAINGDSRVKPETRERIMQIATSHGFRPSHAARSLSSGKSWSINVINPAVSSALTSGFSTRFLHGVHEVARAYRYTVSLTIIEDENEAVDALDALALERATDGVILMNPSESGCVVEKLRERGLPHTMLGRAPVPDVPSVDNDNVQVGYDAAAHLIEIGRFPIVFVSGPQTHTVTQDRLEGFYGAHRDYGLAPDDAPVVFSGKTAEDAFEDVSRLLAEDRPFRSVLAISDAQAIGAMRAVRSHGRRVPEDVAIMGMNNDDLTAFTDPPMSSVELHAFELGRASVGLLLAQIEGVYEPETRQIVDHELVIRGTTGFPEGSLEGNS